MTTCIVVGISILLVVGILYLLVRLVLTIIVACVVVRTSFIFARKEIEETFQAIVDCVLQDQTEHKSELFEKFIRLCSVLNKHEIEFKLPVLKPNVRNTLEELIELIKEYDANIKVNRIFTQDEVGLRL